VQTLIVDDSRTVRRILRGVLEEIGFEVLEAENGYAALRQLDASPDVGLVLTDWDMPEMDGVALLRNLRNHPDYRQLPVVMITQEARAERIREALKAGASDYIMKPFTRSLLLRKISALGVAAVRPPRVLVVDDAAVVRRLVIERIEADPELDLAGSAADGARALEMVAADRPDIVILDVEMPGLDGLETLARLRANDRELPVVMYSVLTERGARATLEALSLGAVDYVTKPRGEGDIESVRRIIDVELLGRIKTICGELARQKVQPLRPAIPRAPLASRRPRLIVVAASTGGPEALAQLLTPLAADFPVPIVVAQHMPPIFTTHFARRLDKQVALRVQEAEDGSRIKGPGVWILPGGKASRVEADGSELALAVTPTAVPGPKPSADDLFRSAAEVCGAETLAFVLTGMGRDGMLGAAAIAAARGRVLVQDRNSAVVSSMPRAVIDSGVAEQELPPQELAALLIELAQSATDRKV